MSPEVRAAGATMLDRPEGVNRPTTGQRVDDPNAEPVYSGGRDRGPANDVDHSRIHRPPDGAPWPQAPDVLYQHVEMKIAADMRAGGDTHAEVVLDNGTCGTRARDQRNGVDCDTLLPGVLPAGSTMTVWTTTDGGQTYYRKTYQGDGSLLRP
ncbi:MULTISPECIES: DddA-like double-stranded DNA deaminase toxin [Catenuloplanes]|uniref:Uncharacterized protein n=1 Tax=Catenuloplanes niger TaxID=587534 RepID=A0AAE3ZKU1_9ACTN|nr:DddA-like double-stranded DNA deaminase toxin [Catenuloplanes niger]MDR7321136.1 hypothetical protein [Catenuloplanes niger]